MRNTTPYARVAIVLILAAATEAGPFTDQGTQPILTHSVEHPGSCFWCHGDYAPEVYEPGQTWQGSMMAQASRDPLFWAALDVANNDLPGIGDFCLRCHLPTGWLAGRSEPPLGSVDGCAMQGPIDRPDNDFDGVSCSFCHRMMINPLPPPGQVGVYTENAKFWIDDGECGGVPCRRGPYDYPADGPDQPFHPWLFSAYHEDSQFCGNCHNVTSPVLTLISGGIDTGIPYPIERTYSEWQASRFAQPGPMHITCQNCHMPDTQVDPAPACDGVVNNHTGDLPIHEFAGGNAWILDVIRGEYPALGIDQSLIASRDAALDMLQNRSALVEMSGPEIVVDGRGLGLDVVVTNITGHKLPTGYPEGRRMWLHVEARDGLSSLLWQSGGYDPATAILTADPQIKIYHAEPGIWNLRGTNECDRADAANRPIFHFVLNNCWAIDNRIPPAGFTGGANPELAPVGYVYPETSPGSGILVNWDTTTYNLSIPPSTPSPVTLKATLRYQTSSRDYIEFLRDQAVDNNFPDDCIPRTTGLPTMSRGEILYDIWERYDRSPPVDMGQVTIVAQVAVPTDCSQPVPGVPTLRVVKRSSDDVRLSWTAPPGAVAMSTYKVLSDASGANKPFIPIADAATAASEPDVDPVAGCVNAPMLHCTDVAAVAAPPSLVFYQVLGVCDNGVEGDH